MFGKIKAYLKSNFFFIIISTIKLVLFNTNDEMYGIGRTTDGYHGTIHTYDIIENALALFFTISIPLIFGNGCRIVGVRLIFLFLAIMSGVFYGCVIYLEFIPLLDMLQHLDDHEKRRNNHRIGNLSPQRRKNRSFSDKASSNVKNGLIEFANNERGRYAPRFKDESEQIKIFDDFSCKKEKIMGKLSYPDKHTNHTNHDNTGKSTARRSIHGHFKKERK